VLRQMPRTPQFLYTSLVLLKLEIDARQAAHHIDYLHSLLTPAWIENMVPHCAYPV